MSSIRRQIEVLKEDQNAKKWCVSLRDIDVFKRFLSQGNPIACKVFGDGSLFSPLLFGKFFDPSDAFPLWEFESEILLCNLRSLGKTSVDWFKTDQDYVLKAELPDKWIGKNNVQVYAENQKVVEICGQWNQQREAKNKDWRSGNWWEYGYVRRLELPEDADWRKVEAYLTNDTLLEIRIPKKPLDCGSSQGNHDHVSSQNSDEV